MLAAAQSTQPKKVKSDDGKYSDKSEKSKQNSANIATNSNRFWAGSSDSRRVVGSYALASPAQQDSLIIRQLVWSASLLCATSSWPSIVGESVKREVKQLAHRRPWDPGGREEEGGRMPWAVLYFNVEKKESAMSQQFPFFFRNTTLFLNYHWLFAGSKFFFFDFDCSYSLPYFWQLEWAWTRWHSVHLS